MGIMSGDLDGGFNTASCAQSRLTIRNPDTPLKPTEVTIYRGTTRSLHALDDCNEPSLGETMKTVR